MKAIGPTLHLVTPEPHHNSSPPPPPSGWYIYPYARGEKQRYWNGVEWRGKLRKRGFVASASRFPRPDPTKVPPAMSEPIAQSRDTVGQPQGARPAKVPDPVQDLDRAGVDRDAGTMVRDQVDQGGARRESVREEAIEELGYWSQRAAFLSHLHAEALSRVMSAEERCRLAGVTDREMQRRLEGLVQPMEPFRAPGMPPPVERQRRFERGATDERGGQGPPPEPQPEPEHELARKPEPVAAQVREPEAAPKPEPAAAQEREREAAPKAPPKPEPVAAQTPEPEAAPKAETVAAQVAQPGAARKPGGEAAGKPAEKAQRPAPAPQSEPAPVSPPSPPQPAGAPAQAPRSGKRSQLFDTVQLLRASARAARRRRAGPRP